MDNLVVWVFIWGVCEDWKKYANQYDKDAQYNRALILGKERAYTLRKDGADE